MLQHRIFESYAWMHHVYGLSQIRNGHWYDTVIPNFFNPEDFFEAPSNEIKEDYLLFIGRLVLRKGPHVAAQIAERLGMKLLVAGPGQASVLPGRIVTPEVTIEGAGIEYVGALGHEERAEVMAKARAVLVPTLYIEPFGGVAVEAMMSGTPAVTTDWGAFTETVIPGVSGERFRTLAEGCEAVKRAMQISPEVVRQHALDHYSLDAVGPQFDYHFHRLLGLYGKGWDA